MHRSTYLEVNLDKYRENIRYFKNKSDKKIMAVIKANGYGLIDYCLAEILREEGIDYFCVSSLDEALRLREKGFKEEILILGYIDINDLDIVRSNNLSMVTISKDYCEKANLKDIKIHLKINTGMNRLGINLEDCKEVLDLLINKSANVEGVMSHFTSADFDLTQTSKQYNLFKEVVKKLDYNFKYVHISATDGSIINEDDICNYQRVGIGLLGYSGQKADLKPILGLYSRVSMVKTVNKGETVSYGCHFTSDGTGYILTVPIGYSDGFYRSNTGKEVYVDGEIGTIVGSICMDQLMIHTNNYHKEGSLVELFGEHIDINKRAQELNTINYELITILSERITRVYIKDNQLYRLVNERFTKIQ